MRVLGKKFNILATSFDSKEQVHIKYPETCNSISEILKDSSMEIRHDVDATNLGKSLALDKYTDIIFNFPHLGKEDCNAHSSMLAHIMNSCIPYLQDGGTLTISLAEEQGTRWKIRDTAERTGLSFVSELEFKAHEWPGYVLMRHHVGRSFGGRVQRCLHYGFRTKKTDSESQSVLQYLSDHAANSVTITSATTAVAPSALAPSSVSNDKKPKKRKLDLAVEGHYVKVSLSDVVSNNFDAVNGEGWQCNFCRKVISTEQGVKTHVYAHVLANDAKGSSGDASVSNQLQCPHCDKIAANQDALDQHIGAKHGLNRDIKPAWAQALKSDGVSADSNITFPCSVCGLQFDTEQLLQTHLDNGFVPQNLELTFNCAGCGKQFSDERGKLQHENFCLVKTTAKTTSKEATG